MADELSDAVERLRTSAERLNRISDQAAELVRDVERFLEESRVGVSASVHISYGASDPDAVEAEWEDRLEYRRLDSGKFRIAVSRTYENAPPEEEEVRAWSECTRDQKLESLELLPVWWTPSSRPKADDSSLLLAGSSSAA